MTIATARSQPEIVWADSGSGEKKEERGDCVFLEFPHELTRQMAVARAAWFDEWHSGEPLHAALIFGSVSGRDWNWAHPVASVPEHVLATPDLRPSTAARIRSRAAQFPGFTLDSSAVTSASFLGVSLGVGTSIALAHAPLLGDLTPMTIPHPTLQAIPWQSAIETAPRVPEDTERAQSSDSSREMFAHELLETITADEDGPEYAAGKVAEYFSHRCRQLRSDLILRVLTEDRQSPDDDVLAAAFQGYGRYLRGCLKRGESRTQELLYLLTQLREPAQPGARLGAALAMDEISTPELLPFLEAAARSESIEYIRDLEARIIGYLKRELED